MSEPFIGELRCFGFNFAPRGWAKCDGQQLPINQFTALFSLYGITYGGDGSTTFGLPDLRGRSPIHVGQGAGLPNFAQGQIGGSVSQSLTVAQMPNHTHGANLKAASENADKTNPAGAGLAVAREDTYGSAMLDTEMMTGSVEVSSVGGGQPVDVMNPYLVLNWCAALQGLFPSRN